MSAPQVDLVLVVDSSGSMKACFQGLRAHLSEMIKPLKGNSSRIRLGVVTQAVFAHEAGTLYEHRFLNDLSLPNLYEQSASQQCLREAFFTEDPNVVELFLESVEPAGGNEDTLVALDIAADFPFGPVHSTKRIIALFSDEPFETGYFGIHGVQALSSLSAKLQARHILLFCVIPDGPAAQELAMVDKSEIELLSAINGFASVDFGQLMRQLGQSISASMLQMVIEPAYQRAIFGQDKWLSLGDCRQVRS